MSITSIALAAFVGVLTLRYLFQTIVQYRKLRQVPGPWGSGWSQWCIVKSTFTNSIYLDIAAHCRKYGPLVRIVPNMLVTNDPDIIRRMSGVRSLYTKGDWYAMTNIAVDRHHLFAETDEDAHSSLRSKMAQGFTARDLGSTYIEASIDTQLTTLFALIDTKYISSPNHRRTVDIARLLHYFVIDVITDIAFRSPFAFLQHDRDVHHYIGAQESLLPIFEWLAALPTLGWLAHRPWLAKWILPQPTDKTGMGYLMGIAQRTVAERFGPKARVQADMLGSFIKHGLDQRQCELEAAVQVIVGSDSTVTSLRAILLFVLTCPRVYARLQAELDTVPRGESGGVITDAQAKSLPYLQAVLKEGMRLFPPVTGHFSKKVPEGGDTLHGMSIPAGTEIAYAAWEFYRNPDVWGEDADVFRPERWEEAGPERLAQMQKTWELVFGYGKYSCLGKPVAMMELGKTLGEMFRRYDIALANPLKPWKHFNRNGFFFITDMMVRIEKREGRGS
ncbi:cytochrome P450 [Trichodelitschia bisporula]|uniref:Cytochrome P450 n=1 Tax=Trichodelitschia bisporula TaxID=703511 RepID=A0A6G1HXQ2_9PEZI|nr:cytochrome P450 [Trichodelitschia bisporula]